MNSKNFKLHIKIVSLFISLLILSLFTINVYSFHLKISNNNDDKWKINVELGIPTDSDSSDDFLIKRKQYVISYNKNKNVANWACWNLNKTWYGKHNRVSGFKPDNDLPEDFNKIRTQDYTNTGYDRGHIVASKDRSNNVTNNKATFLMTNIYPQEPDLNQGPWKKLEDYCRNMCIKHNKELYVIAGGVFHSNKDLDNNISIPDSCYKIIVILKRDEILGAVNENTEVISVMMPNEDGIKKIKWESYKTTVDRIEKSTGYDFLSEVPEGIQKVIERK